MDISDLMKPKGLPAMPGKDDEMDSGEGDPAALQAIDQIKDLLDQLEAQLMGKPDDEEPAATPDTDLNQVSG